MTTSHRVRPHRLPRGARAGFSLIEVLIAMIVFAIGVLGLALLIPAGSNRIGRAGRQTNASTLAAERAEALLTTPYGDNALTAGVHTDTSNPVDQSYYVEWTVTDDQPIASCKRVVILVSRSAGFTTTEATVTVVIPRSNG